MILVLLMSVMAFGDDHQMECRKVTSIGNYTYSEMYRCENDEFICMTFTSQGASPNCFPKPKPAPVKKAVPKKNDGKLTLIKPWKLDAGTALNSPQMAETKKKILADALCSDVDYWTVLAHDTELFDKERIRCHLINVKTSKGHP